MLHRPPYTAGSHEPDLAVRAALCPIFEQAGVDIVFSGHDHMYERTYPIRAGEKTDEQNGIVYIISGAGGARLYNALPRDVWPNYIALVANDIHSFTQVTINENTLTLEQESTEGRILDCYELSKPPQPHN